MQEYRLSFYIMGLFGCVFSLLMLIPATVEYFTGMQNLDIFINSSLFCLFISILVTVTSYTQEAEISHQSSFLATTLVWVVITCIAAVPFYFATLEAYHIGGVYLPEVNAVTDGAIIYLIVCAVASYMEYEWLISDLFMGFRFAELAAIIIFPFMLLFSCLNLKTEFMFLFPMIYFLIKG